MPCMFKPDMHHTWLCIMPCLCDGCLLCCLLLSGLLLWLASVSFRSCEDPFDYVCLSFSWTLFFFLAGSRARWPYPRNHFYLCLLVARSITMMRYLPLAISCLPYCHVKHLTHHCPSKPLIGYVTALLSPSYSVASCRWRWSLFHVGTWILLGYHYYILFTLMHLYTW